MGEIGPTADDLARDLLADLSELEGRDGRDYEAWVCDNVDNAWPAAIRRALAAEAENARLRAALEGLRAYAGGVLISDGDTACSLGWWVNEVLKGGTR